MSRLPRPLFGMIEFRIYGVKVRIDFLFVAVVTLFLLLDRTGMSVIALLCCLIHELGHLVVFFAVGYPPKALIFELTGIRLVKPAQALSPAQEALVQCAGSAANFLVFFLLLHTTAQLSGWSVFAVTHLLLGIFNLLPLKSLDGGKLLELFCLHFFEDRTAERIGAAADLAVTLCLLALAAYMAVSGSKSLTLMVFSGGLLASLLTRPGPHWRKLPLKR